MAISLYDLSVTSVLQVLGGVEGFLAKGLAHCQEKGIDPNEIVETKLYPDMAPFRFQVVSTAHHSAGSPRRRRSSEASASAARAESDAAAPRAGSPCARPR